ncbi:hypothetical protein EXIGLDRAFT_828219 [Exidia glandulosa HHB12029]|uniref:Uncharacterized protein n=1 Tax=Exidia glandulosa HHB12029 TaxID=1314781 RepID=A0A165R0W3_EXIGL|nr:hypothetical protein EXIGLDRAFT_828219 [Exidia glandulosa HHB12029]
MSSSPDTPVAAPTTDAFTPTSSDVSEVSSDNAYGYASAAVAAPLATAPTVPPRTYPRPAPSNLLPMLLGFARILKYTAFGSALLLFVYFTYVLPRLNLVTELRASLHKHHANLLLQLQGRLLELRSRRDEPGAVDSVPAAPLGDPSAAGAQANVHDATPEGDAVLPYERYIRTHLLHKPDGVEFNELMQDLAAKFMWISERPQHYRRVVLQTLERSEHLAVKVDDTNARVTLKEPPSLTSGTPSNEVIALQALKTSVAKLKRDRTRGGALQSIVELTSYISSQTYALVTPYTSFRAPGFPRSANLNPAEDEIRLEIRSLKSLLLNRRSFVPQYYGRLPSAMDIQRMYRIRGHPSLAEYFHGSTENWSNGRAASEDVDVYNV